MNNNNNRTDAKSCVSIPALRFPEFSNEWEMKSLGEMAEIKKYVQIFGLYLLCSTFVSTVPVSHTIRTALGSFLKKVLLLTIIHPPCLSLMHTWGVFSFNTYYDRKKIQ